eukprot:TRINITY_DN316_c1_g1_i1.p1 TRINITY_DN316_c1_g1~~TRINITY_DN316_c1_g1_i1.p1  ORF type:complete len:481 (+),score=89.38 TRINITY_DN316_c1_g1_i1:256-1698(+)
MAGVSDLDLGREEDNVELSLGLSIGGSGFRKRPVWISASEIGGIEEKDQRSVVGSTVDPALVFEAKGSSGGDFLDPKSKREMHALRRQEARKKMEEKQMKKKNGNGNGHGHGVFVSKVVPARNGSVDDRSALEAQEMQCRVRDRAVKEAELCRMQRNCKKNGEICLSENSEQNPNPNPNSGVFGSFQVMPMQMQYPFHPVQFMPLANGHRYPYVMPCWAAAASSAGKPSVAAPIGGDDLKQDKNSVHPVACQSFRPFQVPNRNPNQSGKQIPSCESDQNDGSMGSSSSAVSDNQSASLQGGSSTETRSHSSHSPFEQTQTHVSPVHRAEGPVEHRGSSHQIEPSQDAEITTDKPVLINAQISPRKREEAIPVNEPISDTKSPPPRRPLTPTNDVGIDGKEDKQQNPPSTPSLPRMPCVSTTGPNGKTITGLLYRYTKTEVSIICLCHGSSFSPEEFVKHAGGTDVSHPLRHIVVVPSTFE